MIFKEYLHPCLMKNSMLEDFKENDAMEDDDAVEMEVYWNRGRLHVVVISEILINDQRQLEVDKFLPPTFKCQAVL